MRTVFVRETPTILVGDNHPEPFVRALRGIRVPFDLERLAGYLNQQRKTPPSSTAHFAIPLNDVVEALCMLNRIEAAIYWRDTVRPYFIIVPVACCDLENGDAQEFWRHTA
jgi:hypothetical protein